MFSISNLTKTKNIVFVICSIIIIITNIITIIKRDNSGFSLIITLLILTIRYAALEFNVPVFPIIFLAYMSTILLVKSLINFSNITHLFLLGTIVVGLIISCRLLLINTQKSIH